MTVKHSLLAILTLGPAYGLQLRDELVRRAPHRAGINVGQVYGTLERLRRTGLIVEGALTADNLQLYSLTAWGQQTVTDWMSRPAHTDSLDWTEMLDQVLVVSSIPGSSVEELLSGYRRALALPTQSGSEPEAQRAALDSATTMLHDAATRWLDDASRTLHLPYASYGLSTLRPRRGRRATVS
ncbi:PadR family transcriptional regulator [Paramicrobacterium fandaimingii]|uniref:PadR family transcriptional regulator n=1 Tax=Paramicrobacterium fandaimingii TaxID=2708079 RepID=UPI00141E8A9D|nr:PadR family transcriptional regulator [Microbacterium fandaimingii]